MDGWISGGRVDARQAHGDALLAVLEPSLFAGSVEEGRGDGTWMGINVMEKGSSTLINRGRRRRSSTCASGERRTTRHDRTRQGTTRPKVLSLERGDRRRGGRPGRTEEPTPALTIYLLT